MHHLATLAHTRVELHWDRELPGPAELRARQLRGALARAFANDDCFHQRDGRGQVVYRYPRIQYRWHRGDGLVVGWEQGAEVLRTLPWLDLELRLGTDAARVSDALIGCASTSFYASERLHHYRLASPVLLFNQENYRRHQEMSPREQMVERDRLLVAQMLSALRGFHIDFNTRLYASFIQARNTVCRYKNQELLGLLGRFASNAVLPSGFAFGHAVSHGYGWIIAEEEAETGLRLQDVD